MLVTFRLSPTIPGKVRYILASAKGLILDNPESNKQTSFISVFEAIRFANLCDTILDIIPKLFILSITFIISLSLPNLIQGSLGVLC